MPFRLYSPLVVKNAGKQGTHKVLDDLIDFSDFYATFAEVAGISSEELHPTTINTKEKEQGSKNY